jgi:hypothetical protein
MKFQNLSSHASTLRGLLVTQIKDEILKLRPLFGIHKFGIT